MACFASHVHRVQQVIDAAAATTARSRFIGRSMVRNMGIARDLGLLNMPDGLMVASTTRETARQVCSISTGSQGEPMSALSRMARGDHRQFTIDAGDTVILPSLIPGNEHAVFRWSTGCPALGAK